MAYECVNKYHPDKLADRIAGAIVDLAYTKQARPAVAVEVLLGHGECNIINETSETFKISEISKIVERIAGPLKVNYKEVKQDEHLAENHKEKYKCNCGDNGIFRGMPTTQEQHRLAKIRNLLSTKYPYDGKYIIDYAGQSYGVEMDNLIICQSNAIADDVKTFILNNFATAYEFNYFINPIGDWTGGSNVDSGATNRKLGSDMGDAVTGGGLHGKDLSKADVSVNIYCHLLAEETGKPVKAYCAIGSKTVKVNEEEIEFRDIIRIAERYIKERGGFEKFAETGFIDA